MLTGGGGALVYCADPDTATAGEYGLYAPVGAAGG